MLSFAVVATVLTVALFQTALSAACTWDVECHTSQFCETALSECRDCLNCENLKREPPSTTTSCIKSVGECGPCLKGLVEGRSDELKCVARTEDDGSSSGNTMWILIGVFVVLVCIVSAAILMHLWRTRTTKSHSIQNGTVLPVISTGYPQPPTAPESPPPYRANSVDLFPPSEATDADRPLIKTHLAAPRYLESEDPQRANIDHPPSYVRYGDYGPPVEVNDLNDNYVVDYDDATSESLWTPGPSNNNPIISEPESEQPSQPAAPSDLSSALAVARNTDLVLPPPKRIKTKEANEANAEEEAVHEGAHDESSCASQQINIVIQVNQKIV